jgi:hypothetical protein
LRAVATTSSQILLSRGVASTDSDPSNLSDPDTHTFVTSIFESDSKNIMTLGDAASRTVSSGPAREVSPLEDYTTRGM